MYAERFTQTVTTDGDGAATAYIPSSGPAITGRIINLRYVKTDYADGVDFTLTSEATGETIWAQENVNVSVTVAPRQATCDTAGLASLYAVGGEPVEDHIVLAQDRVKVVIAAGGATTSGVFHVTVA